MARNDVVLLDALVDQRLSENTDRGEAFERFVLDQVLKSFDLTEDELLFGWTDGAHDGGIDAFYTFVNSNLITDIDTFVWPKSNAAIEVYLVTCKHHNTYKQASIDAWIPTLQEIFDLTKDDTQLSGQYSPELLQARKVFIETYRKLAITRPSLSFKLIYASRGDNSDIGTSTEARAIQSEQLLKDYFSAAEAKFEFLGATELIALHRQVKSFSLSLPFFEHLTADQQGYVVLSRLDDYIKFVSDEKGSLRRYLFDSNVRDYLGANAVNNDIISTLIDENSPNFWWLNNGVTIIASSANVVGKHLHMQDIQIVNGLQTTQSIYKFFTGKNTTNTNNKSLLVKIIITGEAKIRDQIIRATNNQTAVLTTALHATEKIQQDIEEILLRRDWFYERRTNYYTNQGKPLARIIPTTALASAFVSIINKDPVASSLRPKKLSLKKNYEEIFSHKHPIEVWPNVAEMYKKCDGIIIREKAKTGSKWPSVVANWRGLLAMISMASHFGTYHYSTKQVADLKLEDFSTIDIEGIWNKISTICKGKSKPTFEIINNLTKALDKTVTEGKWEDARKGYSSDLAKNPWGLSQEQLDEICNTLPPQPWPIDTHLQVAQATGLSPKKIKKAIFHLIKTGRLHKQLNGVVYGHDGSVIAIDRNRSEIAHKSVEETNILADKKAEQQDS